MMNRTSEPKEKDFTGDQVVIFPTEQWAMCRNEPPFQVVIHFQIVGRPDQQSVINCPTCGRGYYYSKEQGWYSDRPLRFLKKEA